MPHTKTRYLLATSMLAGIGPILARQLISYFGSAEAIFTESSKNIKKIPRIGTVLVEQLANNSALAQADEEIERCINENITICSYHDAHYPERLKNCEDAPLVFFYKGECDFNHQKIIAIVGTRNATEYGKSCCAEIIADLAPHNPIIVSGLAFGIDVCAHKSALKQNLQTIAVMGTSLQKIHPSSHLKIANNIMQQGCVLSEYHYNTKYENALFVRRNRIIAGLSDACVVIESKQKGGALFTADFAQQYNRDVFAVPGAIHTPYSAGCNTLIKNHKAALIESATDIIENLNWDIKEGTKIPIQKQLFVELNPDETCLINILKNHTTLSIDELAIESSFSMNKTSSVLLSLEFKGLVKCLPGKRFRVC
ncbi:MAG: DNA-processing protein DprA [Bacteroidales bacterium]|nr:DNA-processing protein DprA [Bacteroidales bacterium]NLK82255.1 DNA-protecting protein DprA [Bacteroidales bacterium]HPY82512.1 DNA-processing protein DprA [Bacteroidales bacterium]